MTLYIWFALVIGKFSTFGLVRLSTFGTFGTFRIAGRGF